MTRHHIIYLSIMIMVIGCQQHDVAPQSKPNVFQTTSTPAIRAVPPASPPITIRMPHYKSEQDREYGYQTLDDSQKKIEIRYLGIKGGKYFVQMNPKNEVHTTLTCDMECTTIKATNYFGDQLMGTETITGPGSIEEVIMQDVKAGLLKIYQ